MRTVISPAETYPHDRMIDYNDFDDKLPESGSYERNDRWGIRIPVKIAYDHVSDAWVAELADALDLGSSTERCEGSTPSSHIPKSKSNRAIVFLFRNFAPNSTIPKIAAR